MSEPRDDGSERGVNLFCMGETRYLAKPALLEILITAAKLRVQTTYALIYTDDDECMCTCIYMQNYVERGLTNKCGKRKCT